MFHLSHEFAVFVDFHLPVGVPAKHVSEDDFLAVGQLAALIFSTENAVAAIEAHLVGSRVAGGFPILIDDAVAFDIDYLITVRNAVSVYATPPPTSACCGKVVLLNVMREILGSVGMNVSAVDVAVGVLAKHLE